MRRREFLTRALALPAAAAASGCEYSFSDGLFNECRASVEHAALVEPLVAAAWKGLAPERVWDSHAHLVGNGHGGQGVWMSPEYDKTFSIMYLRRVFFTNGACGGKDDAQVDAAIVQRLIHIADGFPPGAKVVLLAFDLAHDEKGTPRKDLSAFQIPNEYAARVARMRPDRFEWMASIHPCREDAIAALEAAKRDGARGVKWLPAAMNIDPASPRCRPFYDALQRLDVPLLVHVGAEQAVQGADQDASGNPLLLRHALDAGVRVIAAHCGTLGTGSDLDADRNADKAPRVRNLDLFARLMSERRYEGLIFGDIAAVTQLNRMECLPLLLERREWHARLLNGSDYPLPGILPLTSPSALVGAGLLDPSALPALKELRRANALLFDFVLKRSLSYRGSRFADAAFHTRDFFVPSRNG